MVKMINLTLYVFYHDKNKHEKGKQTGCDEPGVPVSVEGKMEVGEADSQSQLPFPGSASAVSVSSLDCEPLLEAGAMSVTFFF